jgi:hypothetical protein
LFLISVELLENQAPTVRSNAVFAVERTCRLFQHHRVPALSLTRLCVRARASVPSTQCSVTFERASVAFERTAEPATFCASVRSNALTCARTHLSCCSSRPEAVYVICFLFFCLFNYYF